MTAARVAVAGARGFFIQYATAYILYDRIMQRNNQMMILEMQHIYIKEKSLICVELIFLSFLY